MLSRLPRLFLPLALALLSLSSFTAPAAADCTPSGLSAADVVFVGTVADASRRDHTASFAVEEVWRGEDVAAVVTVHGDAAGTEDARQWRLGGRYLVAATLEQGVLRDDACSATQPWTDALASLRPAAAHPPLDETPTSGPPGEPSYALVFLLIVAAGAVGGFLLLRHR